MRGEGDAIAAAIYANAYTKDPEFYSFSRSINAYRNSFGGTIFWCWIPRAISSGI